MVNVQYILTVQINACTYVCAYYIILYYYQQARDNMTLKQDIGADEEDVNVVLYLTNTTIYCT